MAKAEDFTYQGIKYMVVSENPKTAKVKPFGHFASVSSSSILPTPDIVIPEVANGYTIVEIAEGAFYQNIALKTLKVPSTVKVINPLAFANCKNLTSVTLSEGLVTIEGLAFTGCENLVEITIPNTVTSVRKAAFSDCKNLMIVNMGNSVRGIGESVFLNCPITKITLPSTLISIGFAAFAHTDEIEHGYLKPMHLKETTLTDITTHISNPVTKIDDGSSPDWRNFNEHAFGLKAKNVNKTLNVPKDKEDLYKNNTPWSFFTVSGKPTEVKDMEAMSSSFLYLDASNKTVVVLNQENIQGDIIVFDLTGRVVLVKAIAGAETSVDISSLKTGTYIFKIGKNTQKLIVK